MAADPKRMPSALLYDTLAVANLAGGGSIGTAPNTVDLYGHITINQTTVGQTNTFPTPTVTTPGLELTISNIGSQAFVLTSTGINVAAFAAGTSSKFMWTGAAWSKVV